MTSATEGSAVNVVDVRSLVPAERHRKIFELVDELAPGASFVLVNDHDPKPLYYQIEAEYPKQFSWTYLERGPDAWRVEIGKLAAAA
ncbi:MAG: aminotransferase [Alphaproteobacteria bacterium]|nr:MAG: aminotransferase [Alphaproteobacteria bacterium]